MLRSTILSIFTQIASDAQKMVQAHVDQKDLTGKINYTTIYARSQEEFIHFNDEIMRNGTIFDKQSTGNYYLLHEPFETTAGQVTICRTRMFDAHYTERGYLDFEVIDYSAFKTKYLQKSGFSLLRLPHVELVELRDSRYDVRAYFPDGF